MQMQMLAADGSSFRLSSASALLAHCIAAAFGCHMHKLATSWCKLGCQYLWLFVPFLDRYHWGVSQLSNLPFRPSAWICLNHIEPARWKPTIYFHKLPSKFWSMQKRHCAGCMSLENGHDVLACYDISWLLLLCLWFPFPSLSHTWGPPNLSWLTLQWLRYTRQCAPPRPRGRLWYAPECDLQGNEGHATLKRTTKPVELLWTVDEGRCHIGPFPSWMSFPYKEALDLNYQYNSWLKQPIDVWTDALQRALCPSWHHIMATL